jgi:hypothetical protein
VIVYKVIILKSPGDRGFFCGSILVIGTRYQPYDRFGTKRCMGIIVLRRGLLGRKDAEGFVPIPML